MNHTPVTPRASIAAAARTLQTEAEAITHLSKNLDETFEQVVQLILGLGQGRVITCGVGKSGFIARKIAATFASTGTLSFFIHPSEAAHGDLGMIARGDMLLALSHSGESEEILAILPALARRSVPVVAISARARSSLVIHAQYHLNTHVQQEACPLGLAPTTSTTTALALGDALAVALLEARGFQSEDFAVAHPAGRLGRRLLVHVQDIMRRDTDIPKIAEDATVLEALLEISQKRLGMVATVDRQNRVVGIITDGDIRRMVTQHMDLQKYYVRDIMHTEPKTIEPQALASEALTIMETQAINGLLVTDDKQRLVGAFNMHDLLKAGVV